MSTLTEKLKGEIEAVASELNLAPSTVGLRVGQGGRFYLRLQQGKRVWPETYGKVMAQLQEMRVVAHCDTSHGDGAAERKGAAQ